MSETQREEARRRRQAEKRRSHLNDPPPKRWTLRNMWVFGQHLPLDWGVIICTVFLTLMGSLMVLSASSYEMGVTGEGNAMSTFTKQLLGIGLGAAAFIVMANIDYRWFNNRKVVMALILTSFVMLALVKLLPMVPAFNKLKIGIWSPYVNSAYRWLYIGYGTKSVSMQPSEILKVAVIVYLSYYITHNQKNMHRFWRCNFPALCVVGFNALLVVIQPNLSTTSLIVFVTLFMLMAGGMRKRSLFVMLAAGVVALVALAVGVPLTDDAAQTAQAVVGAAMGPAGPVLLCAMLCFFALSTLPVWWFYGLQCVRHLFQGAWVESVYTVLYLLVAFLGCLLPVRGVWAAADAFNLLLALPCIAMLLIYRGELVG